jgi:hypothetical protein
MSQYHVIETQFKDQGCLVKALEEMGFKPTIASEGTTFQTNGRGQNSQQKVHIVVPRSQFGGYGDVGFEKTAKGFSVHCDDYDWREGSSHRKFNMEKLRINYNKAVVRQAIKKTSKYTEVSCETTADGREKMKLRVWEF